MKHLIIILLVCFFQVSPKRSLDNYNLENGVAIEGFDPVSYFEGKPEEGTKLLAYTYRGITYYFLTKEHRTKFMEAPEKYEPQYGGWCAYAMGDSGKKVEVDPETYKIVDGKLYLFYNRFFTNTLTSWNKDEAHLKQQADTNWKKITQ